MTRKDFSEGCSWFNINNLELAVGIALKSYTSVAKDLKLKVRKIWGQILTFLEVTGENLVWWIPPTPNPGGGGAPPLSPRPSWIGWRHETEALSQTRDEGVWFYLLIGKCTDLTLSEITDSFSRKNRRIQLKQFLWFNDQERIQKIRKIGPLVWQIG